jgi:hypothetical protein
MELIHVVKDDEAKLARAMEAKLLLLPLSSGILFAGVSVQASTPDSPTVFRVWIGCSRNVDPRMIPALVEVTLYEELKQGHIIRTEPAQMGSIRKAS